MAAASVIVLAICAALFFYTQIWRPNRLLMDPNWLDNVTPAEALAVAHKIIRWGGNDHDAFNIVHEYGGPESIPYLLIGLQRYGVTHGGMVCTKSNCLEALRAITNQYAGENFADWQSWWDKNKHKTREQWLRDGFAKLGIPAQGPLDDRHAAILVDTLLTQWDTANNAWFLLCHVPEEQLVRAVDKAMADESTAARRAAVEALGRWKKPDCRPRLRTLCKDDDPQVRELALTRLDAVVGEMDAQPLENIVLWKVRLGETVFDIRSDADEDHVLAVVQVASQAQMQRIVVDLARRQVAPSDPLADWPGGRITHNGCIYGLCADDSVKCYDGQTARVIWQQHLREGDGLHAISGPVIVGDTVVLTGASFAIGLDPRDGTIRWKQPLAEGGHPLEKFGERAYVGSSQTVLALSGDGRIVVEKDFSGEIASFVFSDDALYVTSQPQWNSAGTIGSRFIWAVSPDTLEPYWEYPITTDKPFPCHMQRVRDVLFALVYPGMIALDAASGTCLWSTTAERAPAWPVLGWPGDCIAVTAGFPPRLEIRDRHTGEVIQSYAGIGLLPMSPPPVYLPKHGLVCATRSGELCLLRWPLNNTAPARTPAGRGNGLIPNTTLRAASTCPIDSSPAPGEIGQ